MHVINLRKRINIRKQLLPTETLQTEGSLTLQTKGSLTLQTKGSLTLQTIKGTYSQLKLPE